MIQSLVELNRISSEGKPVTIPSMVALGMIRFIRVLEMIKSMEKLGMIPLSKMGLVHRPMMVDRVLTH